MPNGRRRPVVPRAARRERATPAEPPAERPPEKPGLRCCYLLKSLSASTGRTYIGFTVNPSRRVRQHNGEILGGANKTQHWRPWEMVAFVHGFSSKVSALQFEWAWQHPTVSLKVRDALGHLRIKKSSYSVELRMQVMGTMLAIEPWCGENLSVHFLHGSFTPPAHTGATVGEAGAACPGPSAELPRRPAEAAAAAAAARVAAASPDDSPPPPPPPPLPPPPPPQPLAHKSHGRARSRPTGPQAPRKPPLTAAEFEKLEALLQGGPLGLPAHVRVTRGCPFECGVLPRKRKKKTDPSAPSASTSDDLGDGGNGGDADDDDDDDDDDDNDADDDENELEDALRGERRAARVHVACDATWTVHAQPWPLRRRTGSDASDDDGSCSDDVDPSEGLWAHLARRRAAKLQETLSWAAAGGVSDDDKDDDDDDDEDEDRGVGVGVGVGVCGDDELVRRDVVDAGAAGSRGGCDVGRGGAAPARGAQLRAAMCWAEASDSEGGVEEEEEAGEAAGEAAAEEAAAEEEEPREWSCAACTLINSATAACCAACDAPAPRATSGGAGGMAVDLDPEEEEPVPEPPPAVDAAAAVDGGTATATRPPSPPVVDLTADSPPKARPTTPRKRVRLSQPQSATAHSTDMDVMAQPGSSKGTAATSDSSDSDLDLPPTLRERLQRRLAARGARD